MSIEERGDPGVQIAIQDGGTDEPAPTRATHHRMRVHRFFLRPQGSEGGRRGLCRGGADGYRRRLARWRTIGRAVIEGAPAGRTMSTRVGCDAVWPLPPERMIDTGGHGQLWGSVDRRLGRRDVAVKSVSKPPSSPNDSEFIERSGLL